jgi:hypothetical protein
MDHESSPSAIAAPVVFANQKRQWTKPAGAPPGERRQLAGLLPPHGHQRSELLPRGQDAIGTARSPRACQRYRARRTRAQGLTTTCRRSSRSRRSSRATASGFKVDSSDMPTSRSSSTPRASTRRTFPVGGKGDTKPVRSVRKYGVECLHPEAAKTYRLVGDAVPFKIEPITDSLGGVSQKSGVEVDGWWYQWDELRGPVPHGPRAGSRWATTISHALGGHRQPPALT